MDARQSKTKSPIDCFAWQYAFYAHLIFLKAPATDAQLSDLARVLHRAKGHVHPKAAAEEAG